MLALLLAALPLVLQPPQGCLAAAAVSALRAEGISAPEAPALMRELHVFTDGVEPADLSKELRKRGLILLRFQPKPHEVREASARFPLLVMLSPGHVIALLQGQAMDPEAPRLFVPAKEEIDAVTVAFFIGDAAVLTKAKAQRLDVARWEREDGEYRARIYAARANEPGAGAAALFEEAAAANPRDAKLENDLGVAEAKAGHTRRAIEAFDRAIALEPQLDEARRNRERAQKLLEPGQ